MTIARMTRLACATAAAALVTAAAPLDLRKGSSFAVVAQDRAGDNEVQLARANRAFLNLEVRPVTAVTLGGAIAPALAAQFGAKADVPFDAGRQLYGWPERPGLYCDLLRHRGLGLSAACLNDADQDGRFEEGLRLDFQSNKADLLLISQSGKIIGANFTKVRVPLLAPIAYAEAPSTPPVLGKLALRWKPVSKKLSPEPAAQLWISTPENYTGTEGLSENVLLFRRAQAPLDVEIYGVRLRVHGFDEKGAMRYSVLGVGAGAAVPLLFRGYTFRILVV